MLIKKTQRGMPIAKFHQNERVVLSGTSYFGTVVNVIRHNGAWLYRVRFANPNGDMFLTLQDDQIFANWLEK